MRFGELIALTWNEVDFDRGLLKTYRRFNTLSLINLSSKKKTSIRMVPDRRRMYQDIAPLKNGTGEEQ